MRFSLLTLILLAQILFVLPAQLSAHEGRPVYIEVQGGDAGAYTLRWRIPPVMAQIDEPLIRLVGEGCTPSSTAEAPSLSGSREYRCAPDAGVSVQISYPRANPVLSSLVVFTPFGGDTVQVFSPPEKTLIALPASQAMLAVARDYTVGGVLHILIGYDHLLFVLCLTVIAGSMRRLIWTITGFTVAHSITLAVAVYDVVRLNTVLVEVLIALSILLLAAEILKTRAARTSAPKSLTWQYPILTASSFGLLHGFGFASVLAGLGLPSEAKLPALLFFNIGVELGQLAFVCGVLLVFTLLFGARDMASLYREKLMGGLILAVGITAGFWFIERITALF